MKTKTFHFGTYDWILFKCYTYDIIMNIKVTNSKFIAMFTCTSFYLDFFFRWKLRYMKIHLKYQGKGVFNILQAYIQRMRLQRRLYWICLVRFHLFRVHCRPKLAYFCALSSSKPSKPSKCRNKKSSFKSYKVLYFMVNHVLYTNYVQDAICPTFWNNFTDIEYFAETKSFNNSFNPKYLKLEHF